jgi:hypothetical protein
VGHLGSWLDPHSAASAPWIVQQLHLIMHADSGSRRAADTQRCDWGRLLGETAAAPTYTCCHPCHPGPAQCTCISHLLKGGPLVSAGYLGKHVREGPPAVNSEVKVPCHDDCTATLARPMRCWCCVLVKGLRSLGPGKGQLHCMGGDARMLRFVLSYNTCTAY